MNTVTTFLSLTAALRAGYQVYDRTATGYLVRNRVSNGWTFGIVFVKGY